MDTAPARILDQLGENAPASSPSYAAAAARKAGGGGTTNTYRGANDNNANKIVSALPSVPCTTRYPSVGPELADVLPAPFVPRASGGAVSAEKPNPTFSPDKAERKMTALQAHAAWFDSDGDGLIFPADTWRGFHKIGFNWFLSLIAVFVIHGTFSYWTAHSTLGFFRDLFRGGPLYVERMDRALHGSHSGTYDTEGRFIPARFETIFANFEDKEKGGLTWGGVLRLLRRNRSIMDPVGMMAAFLEWGALYWLAADHQRGVLSKEDVRMSFDGTLWEKLAARTAARRSGRVHAS